MRQVTVRLVCLTALCLAGALACANPVRPAERGGGNQSGVPAGDQTKSSVKQSLVDILRKSPNVMLGVPTDADPSDDFVMDKREFVVSYNRRRNQANWVAWRVTADDLGLEGRSEAFRADQELPSDFSRVGPNEYKGSAYDRGHLCPSSHRTKDHQANALTFLMTNMQPQVHTLNAGPWKSLETYERDLAAEQGKDVYVVAGALFAASPATIGNGVTVPRATFRVTVVLPHGAGLHDVTASTPVYAIEMPNDNSVRGRKWPEFRTAVDNLERDSGYDFLAALPDDIEAQVEARSGRSL
jgi:endonuclease G